MPFTEEHHHFRRVVREFVEQEINHNVDKWEADEMMPLHDVFATMASLGFLGLEYEPEYGGQGADHLFTVILARGGGTRPPRCHRNGRWGAGRHGHPLTRRVRHPRAETAVPRSGDAWRTGRLHRSDRAGCRIGRLRHPNPSRQGWRRVGHQWLQDLYHELVAGRLAVPAGPHIRRAGIRRNEPDRGAYGRTRVLRVQEARTSWECGRRIRACSRSTTAECPSKTPSESKGVVSSSRWRSSSSSGCGPTTAQIGGVDLALQRTKDYLKQRVVFGKPLMANQYLQYRLAELAADNDMLRHYNYAGAEAHMAGQDATRFATHRQAQERSPRSGGRRLLPPISRRHRVHGGNLDRQVLPRPLGSGRSAAGPMRRCSKCWHAWMGSGSRRQREQPATLTQRALLRVAAFPPTRQGSASPRCNCRWGRQRAPAPGCLRR